MDGISEEELAALLGAGGTIAEEQAKADAAMKQATMLRQSGKLPGLRDAGATVRAPHALEALSSVANNYMAGKQEKTAGDAQATARMGQQSQNQAILAAILRARKPQGTLPPALAAQAQGAPGVGPGGPGFKPGMVGPMGRPDMQPPQPGYGGM